MSIENLAKSFLKITKTSKTSTKTKTKKASKTPIKEIKDINIQVSKTNIGVGDLSIIVFCSYFNSHTMNNSEQKTIILKSPTPILVFGDLNVDILEFFYRRLARFLRFCLRACLRSLRYLEEWLGEIFNTQCSVLSSFSSSFSIFNIEKFIWYTNYTDLFKFIRENN